jgi:predicted  nucleic acid-binding Zn-ribbon protein
MSKRLTLKDLKTDLTILAGEVNVLRSDIEQLKAEIETLKALVNYANNDIKELTKELENMKNKIDIQNKKIVEIKTDFIDVFKTYKYDFMRLNDRISALEDKMENRGMKKWFGLIVRKLKK